MVYVKKGRMWWGFEDGMDGMEWEESRIRRDSSMVEEIGWLSWTNCSCQTRVQKTEEALFFRNRCCVRERSVSAS